MSNKYERDFTASGSLKRPGRIDLRLFQDILDAGDGQPGLQRVIKNLQTGFYDRYVLEGCVFNGSTVTAGYVIWDGVVTAVVAKNITIVNGQYLYIDSDSVVQKTSVVATAEAGIIIYMKAGGVTTQIKTYFEDNQLILYKLIIKTDLEVDTNLSVDGTITIDGAGTIGGTLDVTGNFTLGGNLVLDSGDISGVGTITATTIETTADLDMNNKDIDGIKNLSGEAGVAITLEDDLDVGGNDLDMSNGNIDDVASIDGGGNAIVFNDTLDISDEQILDAMIVTFNSEIAHGSSGATETIDFDAGQKHSVTISENCTLTLAPPDNGVGNFIIKLVNGSAFTLAWATEGAENVYWAESAEPTWTASGTDLISIYYDGSDFYCLGATTFG